MKEKQHTRNTVEKNTAGSAGRTSAKPSARPAGKSTARPGRKTNALPAAKSAKPARPSGSRSARPAGKVSARPSPRPAGTSVKRTAAMRREARKRQLIKRVFMIEGVLIAVVLCALVCVKVFVKKDLAVSGTIENSSSEESSLDAETQKAEKEKNKAEEISFSPHCTDKTNPSNYIQYTEINVDGTTLNDIGDYHPLEQITFGHGNDYTDVDGIVTFRGNSFRDTASLGYAEMKENILEKKWSYDTGSLTYGNASWTGSGWTGQPLMAKWPKETKAVMNMYDWAKEDDELVEVIYACMDGYIYFLELDTGKPTREPLYLGYTFKGAGALDPRGYPLMYVGAGYDSNNGTAKAFIISLIDCSVLYTFGDNDPFSMRGSLSYFDSSALVDAETDTLIYPGENGILYLMKLNTSYDEKEGTLSIAPGNIVKWHYYGTRTSVGSYWLGMEDSAAIYGGYLFVADNGGNLMCIDLNTLKLVWVQDVLDDSNSTPVLSIEDGHLYLYVSTSFHLGWRSYDTAEIPIWKIDAETGEIVWQTPYECYTEDGVSGGVQSTIAPGTGDLSDYIYVTVARTGEAYDGVLSCINKKTGEVEWEHKAYYAWSSPVCVYNSDGSGKVLYCSCGGKMYLLDGKTGELCHKLELSDGAIEASPAVYENYAVVGTRDSQIIGIELK